MNLVIIGRTYGVKKDVLERVAQAAFSYLKVEQTSGEIELKFVGRDAIRALNNTYRQIDRPTDVLSFQVSESPLVGQILICYTYTVDQARKAHRNIEDEIALLTVHGILHVFGYDHANSIEEKQMQDVERIILKSEGFTR